MCTPSVVRPLSSRDDRVVGGDRAIEITERIGAARAHALEGGRINVARVAGFVELNVLAPRAGQLLDHPPLDAHHVGEKRVGVGIHRVRALDVAHLRDAIGTHQRHLHRPRRHAAREPILLHRKAAQEPQARGRRRTEAHDGVVALGERALVRAAVLRILEEVAPRAGPEVPALHLGEADLPVQAPELPVGDDWQAVALLLGDHRADGGILRGAQFVRIRLTRGVTQERLLQGFGAEQTADVVDSRGAHVGRQARGATVRRQPISRRSLRERVRRT